jgi:tetratricopeptide (TPR) repeat protein
MSKAAGAEYFDVGVKLARLGKWEEAAAAYKKALLENPKHVEAQMNLGFVYYEMGMDTEAQEAFSAARSLRDSLEKCDSSEF